MSGSFMKRRNGFFMQLRGMMLKWKTQTGIICVHQLWTLKEMSMGNTQSSDDMDLPYKESNLRVRNLKTEWLTPTFLCLLFVAGLALLFLFSFLFCWFVSFSCVWVLFWLFYTFINLCISTFDPFIHNTIFFLSMRYYLCWVLNHFSCVQLFATLWNVACQAPLSMGLSGQEHCISCVGRRVLYHSACTYKI